MKNVLTYLAGGMLGDFIYELSVIKEKYLETGKKGILYLSEKGDIFRFGLENTFQDTYSLLIKQDYIEKYEIYNNQDIDIDLTLWRTNQNVDYKNWYFKYSETYNVKWGKHKWLQIDEIDEKWANKVIINTTDYRWPIHLDFRLLYSVYKDDIIFVSSDETQYRIFKSKTGCNIDYYKPVDFNDLCSVINSCKLFIGSQSAPLHIASAFHKKIILGECLEDNHSIYGNHYVSGIDSYLKNIHFSIGSYLVKYFDWKSYVNHYPDIQAKITKKEDAWHHWLNFGKEEGRQYFSYLIKKTKKEDNYTAIIIEPRKHDALSFVLKNFTENLSEKWNFIIFHGIDNQEFVENIVKDDLKMYKNRFQLINLNVYDLFSHDYSDLIKKRSFYDHIKTETFLIFQVDTLIIKENKHLLDEFLDYDYVGAPWQDGVIGNGGLSLRKKSIMLQIIDSIDPDSSNYKNYKNEDEYFCRQNIVPLDVPSFEEAKKFSVETVFCDSPFGVHNFYNHLSKEDTEYLINKYDDLRILKELNTIRKSLDTCKFSIIYKTYKNDLPWLEWSLLSLKKFLDPTNVYEIVIYTHNVVFPELFNLLIRIQLKHFINYRIIPVHYNYHGYIKQQQVKADCYKDIKTKYVLFLDSDLLLTRKLNCCSLLRSDGKIEWKYLRKVDDPHNQVFNVWKKACEDASKIPKTVHYMSNGFPFIFTTRSLEHAANHFKKIHNCDYDEYCHKRCEHENIRVEDSTTDIFDRLSRVFTEFEYLGYYCHHFSDDYIFVKTPYCRMDAQFQKENADSYFIQNWSHGGLNDQILQKIKQILQI